NGNEHANATMSALVAAPPTAAEEPLETVRIEIGEMDALLADVSETGVQLSSLRGCVDALEQAEQVASALVEHLSPRRGATLTASSAATLSSALSGSARERA